MIDSFVAALLALIAHLIGPPYADPATYEPVAVVADVAVFTAPSVDSAPRRVGAKLLASLPDPSKAPFKVHRSVRGHELVLRVEAVESPAPRIECAQLESREYGYVRSPPTLHHPGGQRLNIRASARYTYCLSNTSGNKWVIPRTVEAKVSTADGRDLACTYYDRTWVNFYLFSYGGANVNPPRMSVGCFPDDNAVTVTRTVAHHRLNNYNGRDPRWRAVIEVVYDLYPNDHRQMSDAMSLIDVFRHGQSA